jgi:hypothetical protein
METVRIELTKEEAQAIVDLMDIAVKTKGLEVAETAVYLLKKLNDAFIPKPEKE